MNGFESICNELEKIIEEKGEQEAYSKLVVGMLELLSDFVSAIVTTAVTRNENAEEEEEIDVAKNAFISAAGPLVSLLSDYCLEKFEDPAPMNFILQKVFSDERYSSSVAMHPVTEEVFEAYKESKGKTSQ